MYNTMMLLLIINSIPIVTLGQRIREKNKYERALKDSIREKIINDAEFIFEGRIIGYERYFSPADNKMILTNFINITKILRGGDILKKGIVEVDEDIESFAPAVFLDSSAKRGKLETLNIHSGFFFLSRSSFNPPENQVVRKSVNIRLQAPKYYSLDDLTIFLGNNTYNCKHFRSTNATRRYLKKFPGVSIPRD
jgi:hypothetical protein